MLKLLLTSLSLGTLALSACLGDAELPETYTCTASIKPRKFQYIIKGDTLHIPATKAEGGGNVLRDPGAVYKRLEPGPDQDLAIYGTWLEGKDRADGKRVERSLRFAPDKVTAISTCYFRDNVVMQAETSSSAIVRAGFVEILEVAQHTEEAVAQ